MATCEAWRSTIGIGSEEHHWDRVGLGVAVSGGDWDWGEGCESRAQLMRDIMGVEGQLTEAIAWHSTACHGMA